MRKTYVKPTAVGVAFVINENIATSNPDLGTLYGGGDFKFEIEGVCNTYFNSTGIPTGLPAGNFSIADALIFYAEVEDAIKIQAMMDAGTFNCYGYEG